MNQILQQLQNPQLFGIQWDPVKFQSIFKEVVALFQIQNDRISDIFKQLNQYETKTTVKEIKEDVSNIKILFSEEMSEFKVGFEKGIKKVHDNLEDFIDITESNNLKAIGETRRLVSSEIQAHLTTTNKGVGQDEINRIDNKLAIIESQINSLPEKERNNVPPQSSFSTNPIIEMRLGSIEKKVGDIESKVITISSMENDLSSLMLAFPTVTSSIDHKITELRDLIVLNEKPSMIKSHTNTDFAKPTETSSSFQNVTKKVMTSEMLASLKHHQPPSSAHNEGATLAPIKATEATVLPSFEDMKKIEIKPPNLQEDKKIVEKQPSVKVETKIETVTLPKENNNLMTGIEIAPIHDSPHEHIVQVFENRTYTTELQSSMRVVSELEWIKQMLSQHHDVIRQMQQNIRTQQENSETLTENIFRVNNSNNARIAQLAQQQLNQRQEYDDMRRVFIEQINALRQKIVVAPISKIDKEIKPQSTRVIEMHKDEAREKIEQSVVSVIENAAPTIDIPMVQITRHDSRKLSSTESRSTETSFILSPKRDETPTERKNEKFQMAKHTEDIKPESQKPDTGPTISFKTIDTTPVPVSVVQRKKKVIDTEIRVVQHNTPDAPYLAPPPIQVTDYQKPQKMISEVKITYNALRSKRPRTAGGNELPDVSDEIIEQKVNKAAKRVVGWMTEQVYREISEQSEKIQKTANNLISLVDRKIDRDFVERMFNKFRVMLSSINEEIEGMQCSFLNWITRDELEIVLQKFASRLTEDEDAAATKHKFECLLCGKPRTHLSGMILDEKHELSVRASAELVSRKQIIKPVTKKKNNTLYNLPPKSTNDLLSTNQ